MDLWCDQAPSQAFSPLNRDNPLNRDTLNRDTTVFRPKCLAMRKIFKEKNWSCRTPLSSSGPYLGSTSWNFFKTPCAWFSRVGRSLPYQFPHWRISWRITETRVLCDIYNNLWWMPSEFCLNRLVQPTPLAWQKTVLIELVFIIKVASSSAPSISSFLFKLAVYVKL